VLDRRNDAPQYMRWPFKLFVENDKIGMAASQPTNA
jgi:hypothetical protein